MVERRQVYRNGYGIRRELVWNDNGEVVFNTDQDVEPVLESIARDRETMRHGTNKVAARLPAIEVEKLTRRGIYNDPDAFKKWLNGPEAAEWRIWRGNL